MNFVQKEKPGKLARSVGMWPARNGAHLQTNDGTLHGFFSQSDSSLPHQPIDTIDIMRRDRLNQDGKSLGMSISMYIKWERFSFFYYCPRLQIATIDTRHSSSGIFTSSKTNKPYNGPELSTYKSSSNLYKWWSFYTPNKRLQTAMTIQVNTRGMKHSPFIGTNGTSSIELPPVSFYMRPMLLEIIQKYEVQSGFIIKAIVSRGLTSHLRC